MAFLVGTGVAEVGSYGDTVAAPLDDGLVVIKKFFGEREGSIPRKAFDPLLCALVSRYRYVLDQPLERRVNVPSKS